MQLRPQHRCARRQKLQDKRPTCGVAYPFPKFSMPILQVRVVASVISNPSLLRCDLLLRDYIYDRQRQRSPSYALRLDCAELHGQSKLQERCNKHICLHHEQKARAEIKALNDDKEFLQTDLI